MTETTETIKDPAAEPRRLTRSREGRWLGGVSAGLGAYFDLNPMVYRIAFAALALAGGTGILLYVAAWLVIPDDGEEDSIAADGDQGAPRAAVARSIGRRPARLRRDRRAVRGALLAEPGQPLARGGARGRGDRLVAGQHPLVAEAAAATATATAGDAQPARRHRVAARCSRSRPGC